MTEATCASFQSNIKPSLQIQVLGTPLTDLPWLFLPSNVKPSLQIQVLGTPLTDLSLLAFSSVKRKPRRTSVACGSDFDSHAKACDVKGPFSTKPDREIHSPNLLPSIGVLTWLKELLPGGGCRRGCWTAGLSVPL